jgi:hypothetical protein
MEIYTIQRPSLLAPACAPSAPAMPSGYQTLVMTAAKRSPLPWAHQVQIQAELAQALVLAGSGNGTTGFVGTKRISVTDGGSGVPPRGRPV